jgi:hypothetical protein
VNWQDMGEKKRPGQKIMNCPFIQHSLSQKRRNYIITVENFPYPIVENFTFKHSNY